MLNNREPHVHVDSPSSKIVPFEEYFEIVIYKSTFVSQFATNPFLSKDCLSKVKKSIFFHSDYVSVVKYASICLLGGGNRLWHIFCSKSLTKVFSIVNVAQKGDHFATRVSGGGQRLLVGGGWFN
jgi:hypothetical protein